MNILPSLISTNNNENNMNIKLEICKWFLK